MKSNLLCASTLFLCLLFSIPGQSHSQKYSPEFQALLNQIQQNYLAQKGDNLSSLRNRHPTVVATLIGYSLRQQTVYVQQNSSLKNEFTNLQREARAYIEEVARTTTVRLVDGSMFNPEDLWSMVNGALQGRDDGWILETFGVRTGTLPSVLAASRRPEKQIGPSFDPYEKPKETNQINLLGNTPPRIEKGPPKEETPPPLRQVTLNPDGIQGIWYSENSAQLKIWKEGDTYLGMLTNQQGYAYEKWPSNEICLRLKYVGRDDGQKAPNVKGRLVFKGKHKKHVGNPTGNNYEWQDKTSFYQVTSDGVETFGAYRYSIGETSFKRNPR